MDVLVDVVVIVVDIVVVVSSIPLVGQSVCVLSSQGDRILNDSELCSHRVLPISSDLCRKPD